MLRLLIWQLVTDPHSQNFTNQGNRLFIQKLVLDEVSLTTGYSI